MGFPPGSHLQCVVYAVPNDLHWADSRNELPSHGCRDIAHPAALLWKINTEGISSLLPRETRGKRWQGQVTAGLSLPSMGSCSLEQSQTAHCCAASLAEMCPSQDTGGHPDMGWQAFRRVVPSVSPAHYRASFNLRMNISLNASKREVCFANQSA